jgi:hypothetical protein
MYLPLPESNQLPHNLSGFGTQDGIESHPGSCQAKKEHKLRYQICISSTLKDGIAICGPT